MGFIKYRRLMTKGKGGQNSKIVKIDDVFYEWSLYPRLLKLWHLANNLKSGLSKFQPLHIYMQFAGALAGADPPVCRW